MEIKTIPFHWRNIVKTDYLASDDIRALVKEHGRCIVTIDHVTQHLPEDDENQPRKQQFRMNGQRGSWTIIHFKEQIKSWVCNSTNSQTMLTFVKGRDDDKLVTAWAGLTIELMVDESINFHNNQGGIIVMGTLPITKLPELTPENKDWEGFVVKVNARINEENQECADIELAKTTIRANLAKSFTISDETWSLLCS